MHLVKLAERLEEDSLKRLADSYLEFMGQAGIRSWTAAGGEVDVATEHRPASSIVRLAELGHRSFSEKFTNEIRSKSGLFEKHGASIQFFGRIQSNKLKHVLSHCETVESIGNQRQADLCLKTMRALSIERRCYIQVNIGMEPQKNGVPPHEASRLVDHCRAIGLRVSGLMCIPPRIDDPAPHYRRLRRLAVENSLRECQMGFSADYGIAISEGSTSIRIASLLFDRGK